MLWLLCDCPIYIILYPFANGHWSDQNDKGIYNVTLHPLGDKCALPHTDRSDRCDVLLRLLENVSNVPLKQNLYWYIYHIHICSTYQFIYEENLCYWRSNLDFKVIIWSLLTDKSKNHSANFLDENACRTQDSGWVYSTQNYCWKYYIRSTLHNNTSMLNKYGPDIIKNAEMHVGRPLLGA